MKIKLLGILTALTMFGYASVSVAGSKWVRIGWEGDAATEATISFTPSGSNNNAYISYGYNTSESSWSTRSVTFTTSMASITSKHTRLTGLLPDSAVYFRVCDNGGCGQRYWFRTAPDDNSPFVVVAGGDTRSGWTNRRNGNRLVAKVRPLFVMHGGDFTNSNNNSEWSQWLEDWELSYSSDSINGTSYRRIYPMVSTHGNHEDGDISTICKMFGVDPNRNNSCSPNDTYYSVAVSPLLRVYTLNSQFQEQSSSLQNAQNNWLRGDLSDDGASAVWRFAQYHKPMFPHYTGKSDNRTLFNWWAQLFYDHAMNVVVESDTHMTKLTDVVVPNGSSFSSSGSGTVYVGEGSWGAPARSANDPKSWTLDLASIQQFKVITVSSDELALRTAQFDSSASTLSKSQRDSSSTVLPSNVNWWLANNVGEVLNLTQDGAMRSVRDGNSGGGTSSRFNATDDTFISSDNSSSNYDGTSEQLLVDGSDAAYGEMQTLIKWNLASLDSCVTVESARIEFNVFDASPDAFSVYAGENSWNESSATWNSVGGHAQQGQLIGTLNPSSTGLTSMPLNSSGISLVQSWINGGSNNGVVIADNDAVDGIDINDRETGPAPVLVVSYNEDDCGDPQDGTIVEASEDTFISSSNANSNYDGSSDQLLADGSDSQYGEIMALMKWDVSSIPTCANVDEASLSINIVNPSDGAYLLYVGTNDWSERNATWSSVNGYSHQGNVVAEFTPTSNGVRSVQLNSTGLSAIQQWISGGVNRGLVLASAGTTNGIDFNDHENGPAPKLTIDWNDDDCGSSTADLSVRFTETDKWDEDTQTYALETTISNAGPGVAEDVVVDFIYPDNPDLVIVSVFTTDGSCNSAGTECNLGDLPTNTDSSVIVRMRKPVKEKETHTASVSSNSEDPDITNNQTSGNYGGALSWLFLMVGGALIAYRKRQIR